MLVESLQPIELFGLFAAAVTVSSAVIALIRHIIKRILAKRGRIQIVRIDSVPLRKTGEPNTVYVRVHVYNPAIDASSTRSESVVGIRFTCTLRVSATEAKECQIMGLVPAASEDVDEHLVLPLSVTDDHETDFAVPIPEGSHFSFDLKLLLPEDVQDATTLIVSLKSVEDAVKGETTEIDWPSFLSAL
ncbi:MAG: hypothetical protein KC925_03095 [Candidatus Doudnabacteria bacterium]|nr:hypothetical protein [Candidatus Doudnabacteria bacterium]MCA9387731.1 hypothetical protein [Candidatus Andersenbacteria bacterium]